MKQSAYTKYRNKILREIRKQQKLGLDIDIEIPLTERQLRQQGIQGQELRHEAIKLKNTLPSLKIQQPVTEPDIHAPRDERKLDTSRTRLEIDEPYIRHPRVKKPRAPLTEEQKQRRNARRREHWESLSDAEKEKQRAKQREYQRKRRANFTEEQREKERAKQRERYRRQQYEKNKKRSSTDTPVQDTPATGLVVYNSTLELFQQYLMNGFPDVQVGCRRLNKDNQTRMLVALGKALFEEDKESVGERLASYPSLFETLFLALYDSDDMSATTMAQNIVEVLLERNLDEDEVRELAELNEQAYSYETNT